MALGLRLDTACQQLFPQLTDNLSKIVNETVEAVKVDKVGKPVFLDGFYDGTKHLREQNNGQFCHYLRDVIKVQEKLRVSH